MYCSDYGTEHEHKPNVFFPYVPPSYSIGPEDIKNPSSLGLRGISDGERDRNEQITPATVHATPSDILEKDICESTTPVIPPFLDDVGKTDEQIASTVVSSSSSTSLNDAFEITPEPATSETTYADSIAFSQEDKQDMFESVDRKVMMEWPDHNEQLIMEPYDYIASIPGKEVRRQLMTAFNYWFHVDEASSNIIAEAVTMLHNASLLIDDIQDNSKLRRGVPSAHCVYGVAQTINSANYVYFKAQAHLLKLSNWPAAMRVFNEELLNLHRGQGMELFWRDTAQPPSEEDYLQMISNKTGGLFRLILRLLQATSTVELDVSKLVDVVGLMFQTLDDLKNVCDEKMAAQKGFFEDLTEGKFSYPIAHTVWTDSPEKDRVLELLKLRTEDVALKTEAAMCLKRAGSLGHARSVVEVLNDRARALMTDIGIPNPLLEGLLNKLYEGLNACKEPASI